MPRPPNYITKLRKLAKETSGDPLLKLSLLHVIQRYVAGEAKLEELNKMVDKYSKTVVKAEESATSEDDDLTSMLQEYLNSSVEN
jgi:hypothetical protein